MPNETVDDSWSLDLTALGLLTVLIRHRDGWEITLAVIGEKYGYGREAMANAMGLLQVARYVVKIRMMSVGSNQWSTEVYVYDTPATDAEIEALLAQIERDPGVRKAEVIEPTKGAIEHAAKHRAKLRSKGRQGPSIAVPRLSENPHSGVTWDNGASSQVGPECRVPRQSADPAVSKKTVSKKTREKTDAPSARSAPGARSASSAGSGDAGEGGCAASSKTAPSPEPQDGGQEPAGRPVVKPRKQRAGGHTRQQLEQAREVCELFPAVLGVSLVPVLTDAILGALAGDAPGADRTVEQLGARIEQRWNHHGYASKFHAGELASPVGAAVAMVRPLKAGDRYGCANPRCEDGADLDSGQPCTVCPERLADRRTQRRHNAPQAAPDEPPLPPVSPAPIRPRRAAKPPYDAPRRPEKPVVPAQVQPVGDYPQGAAAARALVQDRKAAAYRRNNRLDKAR